MSLRVYKRTAEKLYNVSQLQSNTHRVIADVRFGLKNRRFSVVLIEGENKLLTLAQFLLLLYINQNRLQAEQLQFSLVKNFDVTPPLDEVDKLIGYLCVRWAIDDGNDH